MLKKIALACAFTISVSFASWDLFPVLENHKGETRVGVSFEKQGEPMELMPYVGSRYTVMPNLELAVLVPYYIHLNMNNDNGLSDPNFMVRYQFLPFLNAFLDIRIPISYSPSSSGAWAFSFGAQYSQKFGIVNFGSQLGLMIATRGNNKISPPMTLQAAVEADFEFGAPVIPFVGVNAAMEIGKYTKEGENIGPSHTGHMIATPVAGIEFIINPTFSLRATGGASFGKHVENDIPFYAGLHLDMKL